MKKLMLLMVGSALLATGAIAQNAAATPAAKTEQDPKQVRAEWEKKVKDELKLTDDQTVKYEALNKEYNEKIDAVMADASLNADAQKEKKMALKKEKETKLMEILTLEQQAQYKDLMEKKKKETAVKPA